MQVEEGGGPCCSWLPISQPQCLPTTLLLAPAPAATSGPLLQAAPWVLQAAHCTGWCLPFCHLQVPTRAQSQG